MKAVILAAGKSTRTYPLTLTRHKALLRVLEKPILRHNLEALYGLVDEAIIVVGYLKEGIQAAFGSSFMGIRLTYVDQEEAQGTAHALYQARHLAGDRFIVMNGDDIYHRDNIRACLKHRLSVLGKRVRDLQGMGVWTVDALGKITGYAEKPEEFVSDLSNCGLFVMDGSIFPEIERLKKSPRGEYELNEAVSNLSKAREIRYVEAPGYWLPMPYPWSLIEANQAMLSMMRETANHGHVESGVTIKGNAFIGPGTVLKAGTYIEGPAYIGRNCVIGPNAYIRPDTVIESGCRIRGEVVDSVIMRNTTAKHVSYIGHSVVGENVNYAGGTITADFRHDGKEHRAMINGTRVNTGRIKLGAFIGDKVKTGINTSIYPGRKIWPGKTTLPGQVVDRDITD
jgi:bifunctional UDP-N-acetylglucosamine pyrophosphorylase/glucosamine-1-phosphate N-acetyltransferase